MHVTTVDGVPSPEVLLKHRCQIFQYTGEDWDDVELVVTTAKPDVPLGRVGLPEPKNMVLVQKPSQPLSHFRQEGWPGIQTTPFWNIPGQGSAFSNILSAQQHMASSGMQGSLFASTQGYAHASQGLFGSTPTQSQPGQGLFGAPPPPTQPQASLSTFVDAPSTHLPSLNTSLPLFGGGATTASSHAVSSVQQPQTLTFTAQPLPHQNEKDVLLTEVRLDTTLLIPPTIFHS